MNPSKTNSQNDVRAEIQHGQKALEEKFRHHFEIAFEAANELEAMKAAEESAPYGPLAPAGDGPAGSPATATPERSGGAAALIGEAEVARQENGAELSQRAKARQRRNGRRADYRESATGKSN